MKASLNSKIYKDKLHVVFMKFRFNSKPVVNKRNGQMNVSISNIPKNIKRAIKNNPKKLKFTMEGWDF